MAQRRDRPGLQTSASGQTFQVRLPDGRTLGMPAVQAVCCFCGRDLGDDAHERVLLSARWHAGDDERTQGWSAHRACLAERLPSFEG
jgi:hypothetical protein